MRDPWSKIFPGVLFGIAGLMAVQSALSAFHETGGNQYTGHVTNGGGARAHRRWKQRRAAGNEGRRR